jgi:hypothetical protein
MTPKEKAKELIEKFGKKIALIFVDETLKLCDSFGVTPINKSCFNTFWQEVKQEINNLQ